MIGPPRPAPKGSTEPLQGSRRRGARSGRMQPSTRPTPPPRGDEADLYRRHHHRLQRTVARAVNAPGQLIEDACQNAWAIMLRAQPERTAIFAWLRVVTTREAYRLSAIHRRDARFEDLRLEDGDGHDVTADADALEHAVEALEALRLVAALPERQRNDFVLKVADTPTKRSARRPPAAR